MSRPSFLSAACRAVMTAKDQWVRVGVDAHSDQGCVAKQYFSPLQATTKKWRRKRKSGEDSRLKKEKIRVLHFLIDYQCVVCCGFGW